jgi:hypothetical protein
MKTRSIVILLFSVAGLVTIPIVLVGQEHPAKGPRVPELRTGIVPIGSLGEPLGRYLEIEGTRVEGFKLGVRTLRVDTVNGRKLREPIPIWVDNVDLPEAERCVLKGYEDCRMIVQPPAVEEAARESGKVIGQPQAGWQMQMFFVATSAVSPDGLRIGVGEGKRQH